MKFMKGTIIAIGLSMGVWFAVIEGVHYLAAHWQ
jgi:hypothetical protein